MKHTLRRTMALLAVGASLALVQPTAYGQANPWGQPSAAPSATAGASTINKAIGTVATDALTTAAGASYTLTITNSYVKSASSVVLVWLSGGTNTAGTPMITSITPASGSVAVAVKNQHASAALNGTLKFNYVVLFGD